MTPAETRAIAAVLRAARAVDRELYPLSWMSELKRLHEALDLLKAARKGRKR